MASATAAGMGSSAEPHWYAGRMLMCRRSAASQFLQSERDHARNILHLCILKEKSRFVILLMSADLQGSTYCFEIDLAAEDHGVESPSTQRVSP
jgi:hypothetical protein